MRPLHLILNKFSIHMSGFRLYKSSILPGYLFPISLILISIEYYNISILISILILLIIHYISRNKFEEETNTIANPLIILIPIFITTQSLFWFIYILNINNITFFDYFWEIPYMININFLPKSYAIFLFLSTIYIFAVSLSYNKKNINKLKNYYYELPKKNSLYITLSSLVIISILFYIFGDNISLPVGLAHFFKILAKLRIIFATIIIFHLINEKSLFSKLSLILFLAIYISLGFLSVIVFSMRMILFEPLIIILILFLINKSKKNITILKLLKFCIFLAACIYMFSIANSLKFVGNSNKTSNYTGPQSIIHSIDVFSARSAAYFADIIAYSNPASKRLFQKKKYYTFTEIIYGLPLGSLIVPKEYTYKYPFDMEFYWTYSTYGVSSTYISAPSALLFTLGISISIIILFIIGLIQGYIFNYITFQLGSSTSWVIIHTTLVPFYLNGLAKTDLLGFLAYSFIAYWVCKYLIFKKINLNTSN